MKSMCNFAVAAPQYNSPISFVYNQIILLVRRGSLECIYLFSSYSLCFSGSLWNRAGKVKKKQAKYWNQKVAENIVDVRSVWKFQQRASYNISKCNARTERRLLFM